MSSQRDTDWALSKKGNWWRRVNARVLIVECRADGGYWAMVNGNLLEDSFESQDQAKCLAERKGNHDPF